MKCIYFFLLFSSIQCASEEIKEHTSLEDTTYEINFSPCICKKQELVEQAKKNIMGQAVKDYKEKTSRDIESELESKIVEEQYDHFLYNFSIEEQLTEESNQANKIIKAEGKVKQQELNHFVEINSVGNRNKSVNTHSDFGSKGLEVIKGFKSDRKKRQTAEEISKSRPIIMYEIKRK